ncbi:methyltransferase, FxLD system [Nocardiopsis sp. NPDC101807]|uniref:methyltransferase, FxLD system n=1 Tax=Nocardiopsis sp. NPDC101807 TaxID=3364339 RepID=UPI003828B452
MVEQQAQVLITWSDWESAEEAALCLYRALEGSAALRRWWFIRKRPHWRLRYSAGPGAVALLDTELARLRSGGAVSDWMYSVYEPEVHAFGGRTSMDLAHHLFQADSSYTLAYLDRLRTSPEQELGRRELALLLGSALLCGAGLDWFEQGDVWARVAELRPSTELFTSDDRLRAQVYTLMRTAPKGVDTTEPLGALAPWAEAFTTTGRAVADLSTRGLLARGLRAVLAHHLIFAFNRWGLPYRDQHILTTTAKEVVMTDTTHTTASSADAARLREELVDQLRQSGHIRTEAVADAFGSVPRHAFVPNASLEEAYTNAPVHIKHDENGASISCGSQPGVVAMMLEQAALEPGMRVLELGAGTGFNAALLGHLVEPAGSVTTIDVDTDLVDGARARLKENNITNVQVLRGDGALGHPEGGPFDRIIATVGSHDVPRAWVDQLAPGGRLIAPVRIAGDVSRSIVFEADGAHWSSTDSQLCTFMPLRSGGIGDDPRTVLALDTDATVLLQTNQDQAIERAQVHEVLAEPSRTVWSGVTFGKGQPLDPMWLWLATRLPNRLSRMPVTRPAVDSGLVSPGLPWGDMAGVPVVERGLAYLTLRPVQDQPGRHELGVIGHAKAGHVLAGQMAEQVAAWEPHRDDPLHFALHYDSVPSEETETRRVMARVGSSLMVAWGDPV